MRQPLPDPITKPEYSYTANLILNAFNIIARSRNYEQGTPLPIDMNSIAQYLQIYEAPCQLHIFVDCIVMMDNKFLDGVFKRMSEKSA